VTDEGHTFPGVTVCDDVREADWLRASLRPWRERGPHVAALRPVAALVPAAYPAHGRILHRASRGSHFVRWAEVAALTGQRLHAETQYGELIGWEWDADDQMPPEPWGEPEPGSLRPEECAAVAEVLSGYTTTPDDCWFCVWEGYGWPELERLRARAGFVAADGGRVDLEADYETAGPAAYPVAVPVAPLVGLEDRDCILFRGPVTAATAFRSGPMYQSPTLWWPTDRAWCVASELDIYSTYVAAEPAALHALIDHPALEVLECTAEQVIDRGP
jgi:hypothetical protein